MGDNLDTYTFTICQIHSVKVLTDWNQSLCQGIKLFLKNHSMSSGTFTWIRFIAVTSYFNHIFLPGNQDRSFKEICVLKETLPWDI